MTSPWPTSLAWLSTAPRAPTGGEAKTDAKDAFVIADQARMRRDLGRLRPGDEIAVDLRILTTRRTDLVSDRTRQINRLRAQLLELLPRVGTRGLAQRPRHPGRRRTPHEQPAAQDRLVRLLCPVRLRRHLPRSRALSPAGAAVETCRPAAAPQAGVFSSNS